MPVKYNPKTGEVTKPQTSYPLLDVATPRVKRLVVANLQDLYHATHPNIRVVGRQWYPKVGEAVHKGIEGTDLSHLAGAGLVSAVSPNMDWGNANIHAFQELHGLNDEDWHHIIASHEAARHSSSDENDTSTAGRTAEASRVLKGLSIAKAPDANLVKAHRILNGEDPDEVLNVRTAPKTNSFMHNIAGDVRRLTVDGRGYDLAANRLIPWTRARGINSARLKSGKPTRYEHTEEAYQIAADTLTKKGEDITPRDLQAVLWEGGKAFEMEGVTKAGEPRKVGVHRTGQPYQADRKALSPTPIQPDPEHVAAYQEQEAKKKEAEKKATTVIDSGSPQGRQPAVGRSRVERQGRR
jgi:hypothetical protein